MTQARGTWNDTIMVLLDSTKAFDEVDHQALCLSLVRFNVDPKLIDIVKGLYNNQLEIFGR